MNKRDSKVVNDFMAEQAQTIILLEQKIKTQDRIISSKNETISINEETIKTMQSHIADLEGFWEQSRKECAELREKVYGINKSKMLTDGQIDATGLQVLEDDKRIFWIVGEA